METADNLKASNSIAPKIDLTPILKNCTGNMGAVEEFVRLYQQNALEFIGRTKALISNNNFEEIWHHAHKMKNGFAMLGTQSLLDIVGEIESNAKKENNIKYITFLYDCFVQEYKKAEGLIFVELEQLKNK